MSTPDSVSTRRAAIRSLILGSLGAQGITLLASPVLTRVYTPVEFGTFAIFTSVAMVLGTVLAARLELVIPTVKSERDAAAALGLGTICVLLGAAVLAVTAVTAGGAVDEYIPKVQLVLAVLASAVVAMYTLLNQFAIREGRFGAIAKRNLLQGGSTVLIQIGLGFAGLQSLGLAVGLIAGQTIGSMTLVFGSRIRKHRGVLRREELAETIRRHWRMSALLSPSGLLNILGLQLPPVLLVASFSPQVAGWFALTQRVLWAPIMLFGTAVAQVYLGEASRLNRDEPARLPALFHKASVRLIVLGVAVGVPLGALSPTAFGIVFGDPWVRAGEYAQALSPALILQILAFPLSHTLIIRGLYRQQACWDLFRLVLTTASIIVPVGLGASAMETVWVFGVASAVSFAALWYLCWRAVGR